MMALTQKSLMSRICLTVLVASVLMSDVALAAGWVCVCVESPTEAEASECCGCCSDEEPQQPQEPENCCITETPPATIPTPQQTPTAPQPTGTASWLASSGEAEVDHRALAGTRHIPRIYASPPENGIFKTILRC